MRAAAWWVRGPPTSTFPTAPTTPDGMPFVHCVVNGVTVSAADLQNSSRHGEEEHGRDSGDNADAAEQEGKEDGHNGDAADVRRTLCTTVVFQGALGGDRAVRADVPFPWMDDPDGEQWRARQGWRTSTFMSGRPSYIKSKRKVLRYPHALVAHVLSESQFATLWPGHAERGDANAASPSGRRAANFGADAGAMMMMMMVAMMRVEVATRRGKRTSARREPRFRVPAPIRPST